MELKKKTDIALVGWKNYPYVKAGIVVGDEVKPFNKIKKSKMDCIVDYRLNLLYSSKKVKIKNLQEYLIETALSYKPLYAEIDVEKIIEKPIYGESLPIGGIAKVKKIKIDGNPSSPKIIKKVYYDESLEAQKGILKLWENKVDEIKISELLSVGAIGIQRKLVPTKWAITATDDTIAKSLINEIKNYEVIDNYYLFHGGLLGNYFTILFFPSKWCYELIESWYNGGTYTDYETYFGRKTYAKNTIGGYYSSRLPVVEYLHKIKKQAGVLAIRKVRPEYSRPLGVWVVREAVRNALKNYKITNLETAKKEIKKLTGIDIRVSKILAQKSLLSYF